MRLVVMYTPTAPDASPDDLDGLVQLESISTALCELGHEAIPAPFGLDLEDVWRALQRERPDCVFNLVESVAGHDRLLHFAPALLEALGISFTGSGSCATLTTTNKLLAKRMMSDHGLPTPAWLEPYARSPGAPSPGTQLIVKSAWDHGSKGLDDNSLLELEDEDDLLARLRRLSASPGKEWFAEAFIDGREFNLSMLADGDGARVLQPAEIRFEGFDANRPRLVGYKAKWDTESFEYSHTVRSFDFPSRDDRLLNKISALALETWRLFGLRGYARVDFRVDQAGNAYILEVNANPCLSPDAGFAAAIERAGMTYNQAIEGIILDAVSRG
ncbi:MAG TPA: ATP-grasp domain-containing protein [Myxococcota bacterium]|nr:ATP-grasp domain-containing protein [Myxococcota bacterium]